MRKNFLIFAVLCLLFGIVSGMSYDDERAGEESYCENVQNGTWPDFKSQGKTVCTAYEFDKAQKVEYLY